jgi:hypothetical protein
MATKFRPTHEIVLTDTRDGDRKVFHVLLDGDTGPAYTREEWEAEASADWERGDDGEWTFQGKAPGLTYPSRAVYVRRLPEVAR